MSGKLILFIVSMFAVASQAKAASMSCNLISAGVGNSKYGSSSFDLSSSDTVSKSDIMLETSEYKAEAFFNGSNITKLITDKVTGVQARFESRNALSAPDQRLLSDNGGGFLMHRDSGGPYGLGNQVGMYCEVSK